EDAQQLRLKGVENAPSDPRSLFAAGQKLAQMRRHEEAVEKFIAAIVKSPDMLNNDYYEMRDSFGEAKAWGKLADAIVEAGIRKFGQTYRLSEISSELTRAKETDALNRLLKAGLDSLGWPELCRAFYSFSSTDFTPDEELKSALRKRLIDESSALDGVNHNTYVSSRSSNGQTYGFVNGIAMICASDEALRGEVAEAMEDRLEKSDRALFPRVLLALVHAAANDFDSVQQTMTPVMDKEKKTLEDAMALWCVASRLTHHAKQPDVACELLESIDDRSVWDNYGSSDFRFSAEALLSYSYEQAGRNADARRILVKVMETAKIDERQSQYNPGYGEYQYMDSLGTLAERFLQMGYPVEAFIAYRKAYADESMMEKAKRWGGDPTRRKDRIEQQISAKTDSAVILNLLSVAVVGEETDRDEASGEADSSVEVAAYLTEPEIQHRSLIDLRVTMPLEQFTLKIADDDSLKQAVTQWLQEHPAEPRHSLKQLVARLLICRAADAEAEAKAASTAIMEWADRRPAAAASA
ncbi:MAG: hypothetical protein AAF961_13550, partial [Planctomycetota bacterium]